MRKSVGRRILIHHNIPVDLWRPNPMLNSQAEVHFDRLIQYGLAPHLLLITHTDWYKTSAWSGTCA